MELEKWIEADPDKVRIARRLRGETTMTLKCIGIHLTNIAQYSGAGQLPVVLLDHYDNCASGGTMDTTDTLREIIRQDLDDVAFFGIYDPEAVQQAIAAGVGATVTLSIGAKLPMPLGHIWLMKAGAFDSAKRCAPPGNVSWNRRNHWKKVC